MRRAHSLKENAATIKAELSSMIPEPKSTLPLPLETFNIVDQSEIFDDTELGDRFRPYPTKLCKEVVLTRYTCVEVIAACHKGSSHMSSCVLSIGLLPG